MLKSQKFLSIVTISFNQAAYIRQTIESILSQKSNDIEYIIVDPGSTDGSRDIIEEYADRIDHIIFEKDKGPADGLNKGFALASGKIGYFINSDDYLLPGAINELRSAWQSHDDILFLMHRAWLISGDGKPMRELLPSPISLFYLRHGITSIVQQGLSFDMNLFRKVNGFNLINRSCWDYELLCQFAKHKAKFAISNKRIAAFRLYENSISGGGTGMSHMDMMRDDYDRIHQNILGQEPIKNLHKFSKKGQIYRMFLYPRPQLNLIQEKLFPSFMIKKWAIDHGGGNH